MNGAQQGICWRAALRAESRGRLVVHGGHRPILVIHDRGRVFALDNRCPHMGFPLERGSVEGRHRPVTGTRSAGSRERLQLSTYGRTTCLSARSRCAMVTSG